jgi:hypothetical protein
MTAQVSRWENVVQGAWRERWAVGDVAFFEYHCLESLGSGDATAWLHSHQRATVIRALCDVGEEGISLDERFRFGEQGVYTVRFADGLEWDVFEDELLIDPACFTRPDPPSPDQAVYRVGAGGVAPPRSHPAPAPGIGLGG